GIGGLSDEFKTIFRRVFASRVFPPDMVKKMGVEHVRGMLLYGPPGTGKTLLARQIGKMLHTKEPKVVNGPSILNKYVGQSEENIRELFKDAEEEQAEKGDDSELHLIIFDEIDAICRQRGTRSDSTGVHDSIVNQILSKLDGVDALSNILVIGMTNRKDLIDEALLRPGRFEVHVPIELPNEEGRVEILRIHTKVMTENGVLADDVDLEELAAKTKNFTGAELAGLVKSARSFAMSRVLRLSDIQKSIQDLQTGASKLLVTREDFIGALEEVHAAFGSDQDDIKTMLPKSVPVPSPSSPMYGKLTSSHLLLYSDMVRETVSSVRDSIERMKVGITSHSSILIHGEHGIGKSVVAAVCALESGIPFTKVISAEKLITRVRGELRKCDEIVRAFEDARKCPQAVLIIDGIEKLIEYVAIGQRFSNPIFQTLVSALSIRSQPGHSLCVICTCNSLSVMTQLGLAGVFSEKVGIPGVTGAEAVQLVIENHLSSLPFAVRIKKDALPAGVESVMRALEEDVAFIGGVPYGSLTTAIDKCVFSAIRDEVEKAGSIEGITLDVTREMLEKLGGILSFA
ncbi:Vesicular-fusion protein SEC18, partial [Aduncisulcus paluster]